MGCMQVTDVRIEKLTTIEHFRECVELQRLTWRMGDVDVVPLHLLVTFQKNGGLVLGAFDGEGRMVGCLFGFLGVDNADIERPKHCSHMMGVLEEWRGRGVGYRLKLAQREHVLSQGLEWVTWTYDPLESLNAALNIAKLGAICRTYLRELYGRMEDGLNVGLPTDRFRVDWWVASERVARRLSCGHPRPSLDEVLASGGQVLNPATVDPDGLVRPSSFSQPPLGDTVLVEIPAHLQAIKTADMGLARRWRQQTREIFEGCFAAGYIVTEFFCETRSSQREGGRDGIRRSYYMLQHDV